MSADRAVVIVASTRAAAGVYEDRSGPILVDGLRALGFSVDQPIVVPDGPEVAQALRAAIEAGVAVVLTSGGTGIAPGDRTPEMTEPLLDRQLPGIAEALRADAIAKGVPMGMISRGVAGIAHNTIVVNIAGSPGAARDALMVLGPVLQHAVAQLRGADHP